MDIKLDVGEGLFIGTPFGSVVFGWTDDGNLLISTSFNPEVATPVVKDRIGEEFEVPCVDAKPVSDVWLFDKEKLDQS